ncbi:MAG: alpha/beta hydrolase [Pseudomonadota bacterium]
MWRLDETFETSAGRVAAGRTGQGPALILAHGWPWSSYAWHRIIPLLSAHFSLYWYDMPGFGQSDLTGPRDNHLGTQGAVFAEMLDAFELARPLVVAHDFGGAVTLRAHLLHERDYAGLFLVNVVAMRPWGSAFFAHVGQHIEAFEGLPPHIHAALVDAYIGGALVRELHDDDRERLVAPWLGDDGKQAFYAQFALADEAFTAEIEADFGALRCPTHIAWGTDDPWIPLERGRALARAIGTELEPLPGLGHLPQLEAPETVAHAILSALKDH